MTIVREKRTQERIILPRKGPNEFWQLIEKYYAKDTPFKWKRLAMLALKENVGWTSRDIARTFGNTEGHVQRSIEKVKRELRDRFDIDPKTVAQDWPESLNPDQPLKPQGMCPGCCSCRSHCD